MVEHPERKSFGEENIVGERWRVRHIVTTGISGYIYVLIRYQASGPPWVNRGEFSQNIGFLFWCVDAHIPATHAHLVSFFCRLHCISYCIS